MKKIIIYLFLLSTSLHFAQSKFEPGYYIDNKGNQIQCLIKNVDWKLNPSSIDFKLNENTATQTISTNEIAGFWIENKVKFINKIVLVDETMSNFQNILKDPNVKFVEKKILLKVLVEGKINLYYYENNFYERFFFDPDGKIEQLVYKEYYNEDGNIELDETFKQQLNNKFKCETTETSIPNLKHKTTSLIKYFIETNNCLGGSEEKAKLISQNKKMKYNFGIFIQSNFIHTSYDIYTGNIRGNYATPNKTIFNGGIELEFLIPINNYSWSIIFNPNYISYKDNISVHKPEFINPNYEINTKASVIRLPLGVRKYFEFKKDNKIFVNLSANYNLVNTSIDINREFTFENIKSQSLTLDFGIGYKYKQMFAEFKLYNGHRLSSVGGNKYNFIFNQSAIRLGYQFF